ncbi:MAG: hypothetical protein R3Y43_00790 [Alphaproteobacteria bacterium]
MKAKEYYSYNLKLNLKAKEGRVSDKKPWKISVLTMFLGVCLSVLGVWELCLSRAASSSVFDELEQSKNVVPFLVSLEVFDCIIILLGLFVVFRSLSSLLVYRKIVMEKKRVVYTDRNIWGKKRIFAENLDAYLGVILRVRFTQVGFWATNKYIVELVHRDYQKNIPLYISTNSKDVRKIWIEYAKELKLDCIEVSESGVDVKPVKDFEASVIAKVKSGSIKDEYDPYDYIPEEISLVRTKDKHVLKARKFWFDIFNMFLLVIFGLICIALLLINEFFIAIFIGLISFFVFAKKDKLVIKKKKIVKVDKYALFNRKVTEINKKDIKAVNIDYNPLTDRHFIAIYSDNNLITFAKKMPSDALRWAKKFLINKIVE